MRPTRSSTAKAKPAATATPPPAPAPVVPVVPVPKPKAKAKVSKASAAKSRPKPAPQPVEEQSDQEEHDQDDQDDDELAYFQHQRLSNIKRNQSLFSDLLVGTGGSASAAILGTTSAAKRSSTKRAKADPDDDDDDNESENASSKKLKTSEPVVRRSSRASLRLRGLNPSGASSATAAAASSSPVGANDDDDDDNSTPTLDGPILSLSETTRSLDRASQLLASLATQGTHVHDADDDDESTTKASGTLAAQFANLRIRHTSPTLKLTPSRIATMCIAPLDDRYLAVAGDKQGTLALCDMTPHVLDPTTTDVDQGVQLKPHTDSISAVHFTSPASLVTASYDGSVRVLNVATQQFVLGAKFARGVHVQALDSRALDPHVVWYSTDAGGLGVLDLRSPPTTGTAAAAGYPRVDQAGVCEKKIGSVHIHPVRPERVLVASNDTYARVFDVRYAFGSSSGFAEHRERAWYKHAYSCTAAYWRPSDGMGMCTTSYDDLVRVWDGEVVGEGEEGAEEMKAPTSALRHDNKTGRWVTLFRAKYHPTVQDCVLIGNMHRHIDVIDASAGRVVATLGDTSITAVPAVTAVHPTSHKWANVVVGANASGKVSVWTPPGEQEEEVEEDEQ